MSTSTALVPIAQRSRTRLELPDQLTFDQWLDVGAQLHEAEVSLMWWVGDWLMYGETAFADRIAKAAELTGLSFDRLKNARRVAAAFPAGERREQVGWSQHRVAVSLPKEQRAEVLQLAEANNWTCRDVRFEVARRAANAQQEGHAPLQLPSVVEATVRRTGKLVQAAFCDWLGVGDEYARVLLGLYQAGGDKRDWRDLAKFVSSHQPMTRGALQEAIHVLRGEMESESIDRDEDGYWLTEVGFAECRRAFRDLGQQLIGMGAEALNDNGGGASLSAPANS